jgi:DNA-binding transcriptional regulator YdaS (Cro superfamily)
MKSVILYLASLPVSERDAFARRCGTTVGYLRKAASVGQRLGESLCIALERESSRAIQCEELRPDVDWAYLRGTSPAVQEGEAVNG